MKMAISPRKELPEPRAASWKASWKKFFAASIGVVSAALIPAGCLFETQSPANPPEDPFFSRSVEGLPAAVPSVLRDFANGDSLDLTVAPVKMTLLGKEVRMTAFNGSIPGPVIRVRQGDSLLLRLRNRSGAPITLHPHGVRLDYRFDGAPGFSQAPIEDGEDFVYHLVFPDPGAFWYHSHYREDMAQTLGLYGNFLVTPRDSLYWNPVDREVPLIISEVKLDSGGIVPFRKDKADHVMMGRFGNVFLTNGDTNFVLTVKRNEYVRFYVTNACNSRVLHLGMNSRWLKVVGSDNGKFERSIHMAGELIAPGERSIFEVKFTEAGTHAIYHLIPDRLVKLGRVDVLEDSVPSAFGKAYNETDTSESIIKDIDAFRPSFAKAPDKRLFFTGTMSGHNHGAMKPAAAALAKAAATAHGPDDLLGVEWEDTMGVMNSGSTSADMSWIIRDLATGLENHDISWSLRRGDQVSIRIVNDSLAVHSMPHPIHFHGQRFLVLRVNGKTNPVLAWKDTYMVPAGSTVDLLLDASNPGGWMAHCHIAEHVEGNMMFHFHVSD
jgi:suppressor of ftsI